MTGNDKQPLLRERLVSSFCEFVRIDSESGHEGPFLEHLAAVFSGRLGASCTLGEDGNLIARVPASGDSPDEPILLGAHADTVKPGRGIRPMVDDGVIHTDGSTVLGADDKAAIAEILVGLETSKKHPPVEILITHGEEIGLLGAKALDSSSLDAKVGFIFDTSDLRSVIIGGPTYVALDIEILGKSAHAGLRPGEGISAISVASEAIGRLRLGQLDEETTANIGTLRAGTIRNAVPDRALLQAECRSFDHARCLDVAESMKDAFRTAARRWGANASVDLRIDFEAALLPKSSPAVRQASRALRDAGLEPNVKRLLGGTDAIVLQKKGIEAVVMGYGGRSAHSTEEHIAIEDMVTACGVIRHLLEHTDR